MATSTKWTEVDPPLNKQVIKALHEALGYETMMPV
jgi:hypothetical protein